MPCRARNPLANSSSARVDSGQPCRRSQGCVRNFPMAQDAPVFAAVKNAARGLVKRWRHRGQPEAPSPPAAGPPLTILDCFCTQAPNPQTALDIFRGEWASQLPGDWERYQAGSVPLFEDDRIAWG